jgi:quercetin dioxygenase-like cupin family protein
VRFIAGQASQELDEGHLAPIPPARHALEAPEDSIVLVTVVTRIGTVD